MTTRKLGVGIIGAHRWAESAHLPGYAAHERVNLVAICDIEESRARAMAQKFGARKIYTDADKLIADPEVEMVDVCTPTHTHLPLSLAAIAGDQERVGAKACTGAHARHCVGRHLRFRHIFR